MRVRRGVSLDGSSERAHHSIPELEGLQLDGLQLLLASVPYIWNEITVQVAYESDLNFVASVMKSIVEEELGPRMAERVQAYRDLLAETPVDHLEVEERPSVLFRVNSNTWIDATVRYLVSPRRAGRRKTLLTLRILERLNSTPEKVLFPKANTR